MECCLSVCTSEAGTGVTGINSNHIIAQTLEVTGGSIFMSPVDSIRIKETS